MNIAELYVLFGLKPDPSWGKATKLIEGVRQRVMGLVSVSALRGVVNLVKHTTEAATHIISMSRAMGMTVEQTQEWGYVAEQSGSSIKELSMGLNMYLRNLEKYAQGRGTKDFSNQMAQLGMSVSSAKKAMSSTDEWQAHLLKLSDALHGMTNRQKEATKTQLFGVRAGRAMLADMERGSAGLKELFARRRSFGEITTEQATALRDLGNHIKDIKTAFGALAAQVIAKLAPALLELTDGALRWISANHEVLSGVLQTALEDVAAVFRVIGTVLGFLGDHAEVAQAVLRTLEAILVSAALKSLKAWTRALGPWALLAAALTGLQLLFAELKKHMSTGAALAITLGVALAGAFAIGPVKAYIAVVGNAIKAMLGLKAASAGAGAPGGAGGTTAAGKRKGGFFAAAGTALAVVTGLGALIESQDKGDIQARARERGLIGGSENNEDFGFFDVAKRLADRGGFNPSVNAASARGAGNASGGQTPSTTLAPTINQTVNITGVPSADRAVDAVRDATDNALRRVLAATGGKVK